MQNNLIQQSKTISCTLPVNSMPREALPRIQLNSWLIILLTLQLALPILSTDIYLPSLKDIGHVFRVNSNQVQLTLTLYFLVFGASRC